MSSTPSTETKMCPCSACHQMWAESMMVRVDNHMLCQLCKERALSDTSRVQMHSGFDADRIRFWGIVLTVVAVLGFTGFRMWLRHGSLSEDIPVRSAEAWVEKDAAEWPVFHLASDIQFEPTRAAAASHAFLIDTPQHGTVAATVAIPDAPAPEAGPGAPARWELRNPNSPPIAVGAPLRKVSKAASVGVILAATRMPANAPVTPLKLREEGYGQNMRMKVVTPARDGKPVRAYPVIVRSNASSDDTRMVTISKNLVSGRERVVSVSGDGSGSVFELLDATVPIEELRGAPIVDAFGHLAAIVTDLEPETGKAKSNGRRITAFGVPALGEALSTEKAKPAAK